MSKTYVITEAQLNEANRGMWVLQQHNALHFSESHSTVVEAGKALLIFNQIREQKPDLVNLITEELMQPLPIDQRCFEKIEFLTHKSILNAHKIVQTGSTHSWLAVFAKYVALGCTKMISNYGDYHSKMGTKPEEQIGINAAYHLLKNELDLWDLPSV